MKKKKTYKCVCGKTFNTSKSLQYHKNYCKQQKKHKFQHEELIKKEQEFKCLPNKTFKCENPKCGKEHDGSYGSGRFCSDHCRRVYNGIKSNKTMLQNGTKQCNFKSHKRKPYGTWKCERCNLVFETRAQLFEHNHQVHPIQKGFFLE